jgi:heat shock 70kDa protein 1/2/6/8
VKNTISDPNLDGKIDSGDKEKVQKTIDDALKWMNENSESSKDDYEKKQKEVEGIVMPVLSKLQGGMGAGGMPGGMPGGFSGGMPQQDAPQSGDSMKFEDLDVD